MELNWSTFVLEIINFLVLVWILKHFLYQPVLNVIAQRQAVIADQMAQAEQHHAKAEALKQQYEHRLADWEVEREKAMDNLLHELEQNRLDQIKTQKARLAQEEEKTRISRSRQDEQTSSEMAQRALQQGAAFASRLLTEAAGPELESRLFQLLLDDLNAISGEQISALGNEWGESPEDIQVSSAYPLHEQQRAQLETALHSATGLSVPVQYAQDSALLAGLKITIGAWVLHLNVHDELQGFTEFVHVER